MLELNVDEFEPVNTRISSSGSSVFQVLHKTCGNILGDEQGWFKLEMDGSHMYRVYKAARAHRCPMTEEELNAPSA